MSECALWYWRHHSVDYELYDSEEDAASAAIGMEEWGRGVPEVVQFPDGRLEQVHGWEPYEAAYARMLEREKQERERRASQPPRPTRKVVAPIGKGMAVEVEMGEPEWLGVRGS